MPPHTKKAHDTPTYNRSGDQVVQPNQKPPKYIIITNLEQDVQKLKDHNASLRTYNTELLRQVSLFKQIFRNPTKHKQFLDKFLPT